MLGGVVRRNRLLGENGFVNAKAALMCAVGMYSLRLNTPQVLLILGGSALHCDCNSRSISALITFVKKIVII